MLGEGGGGYIASHKERCMTGKGKRKKETLFYFSVKIYLTENNQVKSTQDSNTACDDVWYIELVIQHKHFKAITVTLLYSRGGIVLWCGICWYACGFL